LQFKYYQIVKNIKMPKAVVKAVFLLLCLHSIVTVTQQQDSSTKENNEARNLISTEKCVTVCKGDPKELSDNNYKFAATHFTADASKNKATLELKADARLKSLGNCEYGLYVDSASVTEYLQKKTTKPNTELAKQLQANEMRFGYSEGKINAVCSVDTVEVTNIKKGILSHLQLGTRSFEGTTYNVDRDVMGDCLSRYRPANTTKAGTIQLQRKRNLGECSNRQQYDMDSFTVKNTDANGGRGQAPMLTGTQKCTITASAPAADGSTQVKLTQVVCTDYQILTPFSKKSKWSTCKDIN
jgi:hypothetical protein